LQLSSGQAWAPSPAQPCPSPIQSEGLPARLSLGPEVVELRPALHTSPYPEAPDMHDRRAPKL